MEILFGSEMRKMLFLSKITLVPQGTTPTLTGWGGLGGVGRGWRPSCNWILPAPGAHKGQSCTTISASCRGWGGGVGGGFIYSIAKQVST